MSDNQLIRGFRQAVLNIVSKEGQPATLGTAGGTVYYNDGADDHLDRLWVRMGAEEQVQVIAKAGKRGIPKIPGLKVTVAKRYGSLYVDGWDTESGIGSSGGVVGLGGHSHDYATRNVKVSEYAGTPAGSDNVVIGHTAGDSLGSGSAENVIIGSAAGASGSEDSGSVVIGYNAGDYTAAPSAPSFSTATDITVIGEAIVTQVEPHDPSTAQRNALLTTDRVVTVYTAYGGGNARGYARIIDTDSPTVYSASKFTAFDYDFSHANVIQLDTTKFLVAFEEWDDITDNAFELWLRVGTESAGTISWGTAVQVTNYTAGQDFHLNKISSTSAVLTVGDDGGTYTDAMIITISGTTITVGTAYAYSPSGNVDSANSYVLSATKIVTVWNAISGADREIKSRVGNVSGTTITYATTTYTVAADSSDTPKYIRGGALSSTHFIVSFQRVDSADQGYVIVGEVAGGDSISFGSETEFYSDVFGWHDLSVASSTRAFVVYMDGGAYGFRARAITISGTTPTVGASGTFTPDDNDIYPHIVALDSLTFFVNYDTDDGDTYVRYVVGTTTAGTRSDNVFVGAGSGNEASSGVCIGQAAGANETADNRLYIDITNTAAPLIYGEFDDDNVGFSTVDMAGGEGVIAIANASVVPAGTPTGGGVLYVEGGALKYKGTSGTVTTLGAA